MTTFTLNQHRLLALYHNATPSQHHQGLTWYENAQQFARDTALTTGYTLDQIAGVIAVTSPRQGWGANKDTAYTLASYHARGVSYDTAILDPLVRGFSTNLVKAWRILDGELPSDVVSGPKVTAFYRNIIGDSSYVTLDTHAMNAWAGDTSKSYYPARTRSQMLDDYLFCAEHVEVRPSTFQAVVWVVWREQVLSAGAVRQYDASVVHTYIPTPALMGGV